MKNAADHNEPNLPTSTENSDADSESSVVSMETATVELDAESAAATLLNHDIVEGKEKGEMSKLVRIIHWILCYPF